MNTLLEAARQLMKASDAGHDLRQVLVVLRDAIEKAEQEEEKLEEVQHVTTLREAAQQALKVMETNFYAVADTGPHKDVMAYNDAITALRAALGQPEQGSKKERTMPITDDHGQAIKPQYRVIKAVGNWCLLYDQICVGNAVRHEFRITKTTHDIALYPGISLEDAIKRFDEKVEADHE